MIHIYIYIDNTEVATRLWPVVPFKGELIELYGSCGGTYLVDAVQYEGDDDLKVYLSVSLLTDE